ncbi:hypothetical protein [Streptomyces sp. NRRL S-350]|uniref:hypothetical protein n=1 Tax=Streptomyces sp. NRRL S-350 TaxID=1463902 RepID=UPI0004C1BBCA|nr:hypothetical protein [Streptomyces sp. NRRL S-350]
MTEQPPPMVHVAAYWRGDFTLGPAPSEGEPNGSSGPNGPDGPDEPDEPSLRRLGRSGITVHGRDLAALLAPAYDAFRR